MSQDVNPSFIPQWTQIMLNSFDDKGKFNYDKYDQLCQEKQMFMGQFKTCMVGEARGFNPHYAVPDDEEMYCNKCYKLAMKACFMKQQKISFFNFKKELYDHITKEHMKA